MKYLLVLTLLLGACGAEPELKTQKITTTFVSVRDTGLVGTWNTNYKINETIIIHPNGSVESDYCSLAGKITDIRVLEDERFDFFGIGKFQVDKSDGGSNCLSVGN